MIQSQVLPIQIRRLVHEDLQAYRTIRLQSLLEEPIAFGSSHEQESANPLQYFADHLAPDSDRILLGAFQADSLIGIVGLSRETSIKEQHRAFLRAMYVSAAHRGKGIGQLLISEAIALANAMTGLRQITLSVTASNTAALSLYRSNGFLEYGRLPESLCVQGRYYDEILMIKARPFMTLHSSKRN
jgi:ribosomal protein S18 acetylase RimI-like enzyme